MLGGTGLAFLHDARRYQSAGSPGCDCEGHAKHGCGRSSEHNGQGFGLILREIAISSFEGPQVWHGMMQDGERRHVVEDGVQRHSELTPFRHEELTPMPFALQAVAG
jgi:hypothetical protein